MATLAGRREARSGMVRVAGRFVVRPVTAVTLAGRSSIDVVLMTGSASLGRMNSLERIDAVVAETRLIPIWVGGPMATLAGRREARIGVVRVAGRLVVRPVTAVALTRRSIVNSVPMAGRTLQRCVNPLPGKDAIMIEQSLIPAGV